MNRVVDVIVGMQFGSEGKGKIAGLLAMDYDAAVRVGAPNAGHSVWFNNEVYKMRTIPCAWVSRDTQLFIGAGGLINLDVLRKELAMLPDSASVHGRLFIDINAGVVTQDDIKAEEEAKMYEGIGSTCEGIGEAMARKLMRRSKNGKWPLTAGQVDELQPYVVNTSTILNQFVDEGQPVMVEGTQGFGLSLNHGYYPYVTSRDVLTASMIGECGLAPHSVNRVIGVMRTYPIRVHGNSGPMGAEELTWEDVARESGYPALSERTTVTNRVRRVSRINWDLIGAAIKANRPTEIALMFADYINAEDAGKRNWRDLSDKTKKFVLEAEERCGVPIHIISTGPKAEDTVYKPANVSNVQATIGGAQ